MESNIPVFSAEQALRERWRRTRAPRIQPPHTAILCYQPGLVEYARQVFAVRRVDGFFGEVLALKSSGGRVALAGNFGVVKLLVRYGADVAALTPNGKDAATLAQSIGWPEIAAFLTSAQS